MSTPHWPDRRRIGVGALNDLDNAALTLLANLQQNGCVRGPVAAVSAFQTAYNASGMPGQLTPDGEYGPNTQAALQNALNQAASDAGGGAAQAAPQNCYPELGAVPSVPALDPTVVPPAPATPSTAVTTTPPAPTDYTPYVIGGAAIVGAGVVGYALWRRSKRKR